MKGIPAIILVILAGLVLTSDALLRSGANVCAVQKTREQTYTTYEVVKFYVTKVVYCFSFRNAGRCNRRMQQTRRQTVQKKRLLHYVDLECCSGWTSDNDRECLKAICPSGCKVHEECYKPGTCRAVAPNHWTMANLACQCYWDHSRYDCGCCIDGGCQCTYKHPNKCVQCGYGTMCDENEDARQSTGVDAWTRSLTGCSCSDSNKAGGDCLCCQNGGCPCPSNSNKNRCVQCGSQFRTCYP